MILIWYQGKQLKDWIKARWKYRHDKKRDHQDSLSRAYHRKYNGHSFGPNFWRINIVKTNTIKCISNHNNHVLIYCQ
jgi:hypothetical protein